MTKDLDAGCIKKTIANMQITHLAKEDTYKWPISTWKLHIIGQQGNEN